MRVGVTVLLALVCLAIVDIAPSATARPVSSASTTHGAGAAPARLVAGTGAAGSGRFLRAPRSRLSLPWAPTARHGVSRLRLRPARDGSASSTPVSVGSSFVGVNSDEGLSDPPDPQVGVGAGSVVEMVNRVVRVWSTSGALRASYQMPPFFLATTADVSDPRVLFDPTTGRWFATVIDVQALSVKIAVSKSSDPTAGWVVYGASLGFCPDQPSLGISTTLVVVGYNAFSTCTAGGTSGYLGGSFFVMNKSEVVAGVFSHYTNWTPSLPAPVAAVRGKADPGEAVTIGGDGASIDTFTFSGVPTSTTAATVTMTGAASIHALFVPPKAAQPGTPTTLDTGDPRIEQAVASGDTIWLAGNDGCFPPKDTNPHACLRLIHLSGTSVLLDSDIGIAGVDLFYPAIQPDPQGNLVIAYGASSPNIFPSLVATVLAPDGTLTPAVVVASGNAPQLDDRYGDYFGAAADPDNPEQVWVAGEIGKTIQSQPYDWGTVVARLDVGTPSTTPPPPPTRDTSPPRVRTLASTGRYGHLMHLRYTVSDDSGRTRDHIVVYAQSRIVLNFRTTLSASKAGVTYYVQWRVPLQVLKPVKFCATSTDPSGNVSRRSCSAVLLGK